MESVWKTSGEWVENGGFPPFIHRFSTGDRVVCVVYVWKRASRDYQKEWNIMKIIRRNYVWYGKGVNYE